MDATTFDEVVKEIVARHIAKSTMRPTGKIFVKKDLLRYIIIVVNINLVQVNYEVEN